MTSKVQTKIRIIYNKAFSIFTSYGRNKNGDFSVWCFLRYCITHINVRLFFKYIIYALEILFNYEFRFLKRIARPDLKKLNITIFPLKPVEQLDASRLVFANAVKPDVSIIIAVHNNLSYTYNCLLAIAENTSTTYTYEIIVVNDCSSDETQSFLSSVKHLTLISNEHNLGFVLSCNKGATVAKGEYIHFLNNDTIVQKDWIESMLSLMKKDSSVGIVGSKLIFDDGDIQEAGGIVWLDATTTHYGRRGNISNKNYNFRRNVDYCSGASLLILKKDFDLLNGFDPLFAPGYYEDTDLCFSVKHLLGKKVVYEPSSVIVHFEGITAGTNALEGMKRFQNINAIKFKEKWAEQLKLQLPNSFMNLNGTIVKYDM